MLRLSWEELLVLLRTRGFERVDTRRLGPVPYLVSMSEGGMLRRLGTRLAAGRLRAAVTAGEEVHDVALWVARAPT